MGARQKLNQAHIIAALVIAAVIGAVTQSWIMFWIAAIIAVGSSFHAGGIRVDGRRRR